MNAQGEPRLSVGINLRQVSAKWRGITSEETHFLPVNEYTFTDPSSMATALNDIVAIKAKARDGR